MGRKIRVIILCSLLMGLVGEVRGQLPIYQQWSQTYLIGSSVNPADVVVMARSIGLERGDSLQSSYAISVYCEDVSYSPHNPMPVIFLDYRLCAADSIGIQWLRQLISGSCWCPEGFSGYDAPLVLREGGIVSRLTNPYGPLSGHWIYLNADNSDSIWAEELANGYGHNGMLESSSGIVVFGSSAFLYSHDGSLIAAAHRDSCGYSLLGIAPRGNDGVVALAYSQGVYVTCNLNADLTIAVIDTIPIYPGSIFLGSPSGSFFSLGPGSNEHDAIRIHRFAPNGEYITSRDFEYLYRYGRGSMVALTDGTLCLGTSYVQNGHRERAIIFLNDNLDSLGFVTGLPDYYTLCPDVEGSLIVASSIASGFQLTKYGSIQTPAIDTPGIPDNIQVATYPNPFNISTLITFDLPEPSFVLLNIHDVTGRLVATLMDQSVPAGSYSKTFDASELASGVYIYSFRANDFQKHGKVLLIK